MRHGVYVAAFGELCEPRVLAEQASLAESLGWDGFFLWDHLLWSQGTSVADSWIALAGIATLTERIKIGPLVTPLTRRRPQLLARQSVTLDRLCGGRLILGVGLGVDHKRELSGFGEIVDLKIRARRLDDGLKLISDLWSGEEVNHLSDSFLAQNVIFRPTPIQKPRIPIWIAGSTALAPLRRAVQWDGYFPIGLSPDQLRFQVEEIKKIRTESTNFDIVVMSRPTLNTTMWSDAGATWLLTTGGPDISVKELNGIIRSGPPRK